MGNCVICGTLMAPGSADNLCEDCFGEVLIRGQQKVVLMDTSSAYSSQTASEQEQLSTELPKESLENLPVTS